MVTVKIKENSGQAKALIQYLKSLSFVEIDDDQPRYNAETEKAIADVRAGIGMSRAESVEDLMKKLNE